MRFLLTNDDGIDAPGLAALAAAASPFGAVTVVAPTDALSGCSHRVTTSQPFRVLGRLPSSYAVEGTPADCVRVALHEIMPDADWVLAGINHGGNLGADVWHSGTVAAVREAVLHGWRGIAFSQYHKKGRPFDWQRATAWVAAVLPNLLDRALSPGGFWNVNLPYLDPGAPMPEIVAAPLDLTPLPLSFRRDGDVWHYDGDYHQRRRKSGSDVDVCFRGSIAVTELRLG
jgi:5'-nucleotidase